MTIDRAEDAARHDAGDVLAGGEVGIIREHADQLAPDPSDAGDPPGQEEDGSAVAAAVPQAPTGGPARIAVLGRR